jgi:hypothetical protein
MAIDLSGFDEVVDEPKTLDLSGFDEVVDEPRALDLSGFDSTDTVQPSALDLSGFDEEVEIEEPTTGEIATGVGAEMTSSVAGSVIGGAIGGALGAGFFGIGAVPGAAIGAALGGFAGGFLGSVIAQDIEDQPDFSLGRALGAGVVSAIPLGGTAVKSLKGGAKITSSMVAGAAARESVKGAALGGTEVTIKTAVDEGRMPTKEEFATYAGAGALFGGAIGAVTPKASKSLDKFLGKTFNEIDDEVASGVITYEDFKPLAQVEGAEGERILRGQVEKVKARVQADLATDFIENPRNISGFKNRMLSILAPSKLVSKEARNEILRFRKRITSVEELGSKMDKRIAAATAKDPSIAAKVDKYLAGGDSDPSLGGLSDDLVVYRDRLDELQGEVIKYLDADYMANMGPEKLASVTDQILKLKDKAGRAVNAREIKKLKRQIKKATKEQDALQETPKLIRKIQKSRELGNFTSREYRMFVDSDFVPDIKLRAKAQEEIANKRLQAGKFKNMEPEAARKAAMDKANEQLNKLEAKSAAARKLDPRSGVGGKIDSPLMKRKEPGEFEKAWLGEITETGERVRGTLTRVGRIVAREKTDRNILDILKRNGLAVRSDLAPQGTAKLKLRAGVETGYHVSPEVQASINSLYINGGTERSNNAILAGLQDLYSTAVGLSKATKVLLNPPSYAVQVYGNAITLAGMGVNPFAGSGRGIRLALAEFGGLEKLLSPSGGKERRAFLKEVNDMARYGIKGENIIESDMRDSLERGIFSNAMEKPVGFFGKAYSVPDTVGRYVGWKAQQKMLKKIYPELGEDQVKKLAAEIINDTYQNYDRLSSVVKRLSRMGIMPQFASFTAEFMRNQYNQAKIIKQMLQGNFGADLGLDVSKASRSAMRVEGAKRLTALATVYGGTYAAIEAMNRDGGVTEQNEQAIKNSLPSWDQDKTLAMRVSEDGKTVSYANVSYISPHALGLAAFDAAMKDEPIDSLASLLVGEFVGEGSFINRGLMEAVNNRNNRGNKISHSENDLENAKERLVYFVKESFRPGIVREAGKLDEALRGVGDLSVAQVLKRQVGYRVNTVDIGESVMFAMRENKDNADGSSRSYKRAKEDGTFSPADLEVIYQRANDGRRQSMMAIAQRNDDLAKQGFTESERIEVMKDAGISSKDILATLDGDYNDLKRTSQPSTSEIYNEMGETMQQKRSNILKYMRTDPRTGKRLMSMWVREKRSADKGLNQRDTLMRHMDTDEKVDYLSKNPGMINEFKRKNLLSNEVLRALRIRGVM